MRGRDFISEERAVGRKYAILLRDNFKQQISVLQKRTGETFRVRYRVSFRDLHVRSVVVRTTKVPFIQHFGVDKMRKAHTFRSKSGNTFTRKEHPFKLASKIPSLEIPDHISEGFADEISSIRGDEMLYAAGKLFELRGNVE